MNSCRGCGASSWLPNGECVYCGRPRDILIKKKGIAISGGAKVIVGGDMISGDKIVANDYTAPRKLVRISKQVKKW